jgi:S-DNA-T family DNA segregation ATPase FtsK/SpoIIIE
LIKSNLPARIAFQVASRTDSRVVLDEMGADKLLGNGDLLFLWPGTSTLLRGQGTYVSDEEINRVVECVGTTEPEFVKELVQLKVAPAGEGDENRFKNRDELYESAIEIVIREGRGSVSLLQRALGIGYGRGARLIDFMAEDGIVGAYNGSQAREVLITMEQWQEMSGQRGAAPEPPKRPRNKILPSPGDEDEEVEDELLDGDDEVEDEEEEEVEDELDEDEYTDDEEEEYEEEDDDSDEEEEEESDDEQDEDEDEEDEYDEHSYEAESA